MRGRHHLDAFIADSAACPQGKKHFYEPTTNGSSHYTLISLKQLIGPPPVKNRELLAMAAPNVEIQTTMGTFVVELYQREAPKTVANFIGLAKKGYYDGTIVSVMIHWGGYLGWVTTACSKKGEGP